jgi:hypothetical protein
VCTSGLEGVYALFHERGERPLHIRWDTSLHMSIDVVHHSSITSEQFAISIDTFITLSFPANSPHTNISAD